MEEERRGDAEKQKKKRVEEKICKRCKGTYDVSSNTPSSCRFHPSFFVSRRHDDQKRYYELGPDDPPMPQNFMTAVELKIQMHQAAPQIIMPHTTIKIPCQSPSF